MAHLDPAWREDFAGRLARRRRAGVLEDDVRPPVCANCGDAQVVRVTADPFSPLFGKAIPCPACAGEPSLEDRAGRAGIPHEFRYMTFEYFVRAYNAIAFDAVMGWAGDGGLVLAGEPGRGKTHLAVAALRREIEERGKLGHYCYVPQLLDELRRRYGDDAEGSSQDYMDRLAAWPLLLLDDVGAERATPWVTERLVLLTERRTAAGAVTIVTTNYASAAALADHYGGEVAGARLASRLGARSFTWVACAGEDMRQYELGVD